MTISYNWLLNYLPVHPDPERLSHILTSIGLEVESMTPFEKVKGGLQGCVIGEVIECEKHPDADKLSLTKVNIGTNEILSIVCGAPNVAKGQKVIVATVGTTLYPSSGEPLTIKKAKIRGTESFGMICAEDELGLGNSHAGILVLDNNTIAGTPAAEHFQLKSDWIYEIGLTPNRMDAMSHLGVARDVLAYTNFHDKRNDQVISPYPTNWKTENKTNPVSISIEDPTACRRYAGISIQNVTVKESPDWLKERLQSIGLKPINNIVDITNFILHETGQPLHAFDADAITGNKVIVRKAKSGEILRTLDDKERKLDAEDLMICNENESMCIGGVFGGLTSGVKETTKNIFLESAWFDPKTIRKTSFRHQLRTDAATRFEKGVDISNTVQVLKRAALLIQELSGGKIAGDITDIYPAPAEKPQIAVRFHYLKKISGKNYHPDHVKKILTSLGFEWIKESIDEFWVSPPYSKTDIHLPADIAEEIMRIDGLDQVEIPSSITMSPSLEINRTAAALKEKISNYLTGSGFHEILTNSIVNSQWYDEGTLKTGVKMLNNLSADLDMMRPSMLESGLQCISFNLNRKNNTLLLFEFGKAYHVNEKNEFAETEQLCLYATGKIDKTWNQSIKALDFYFLKGLCENILSQIGLKKVALCSTEGKSWVARSKGKTLMELSVVPNRSKKLFDIKQEVVSAVFFWENCIEAASQISARIKELPKFPLVERDLSMVVPQNLPFAKIEEAIQKCKIKKLKNIRLFDVFENEKLGADKKSMALNFHFLDEEKTMTDKDTDQMMQQIIQQLEKEVQAEIRK
ncbi:MAG: phenylalanine--tRNA ligase subunit beta [Bacteroidota bacterium]